VQQAHYVNAMLNLFLNRSSALACLADCPADNHARQLAQFLYGTLAVMVIPFDTAKFESPDWDNSFLFIQIY